MTIVCATDDNFVQHCSIMLVSLLINNKDVEIFVLTEGLKQENQAIITEEVERYNGKVHFCIVNPLIVEKFPMPTFSGLSHISRATYYRLLIADLLPKYVHKAIYLDCDIIVNHSIEELWNTDITEYAIAASKQIGYGYEAERLGYPIEYGYFNAGMNVINLDYFRENNVSQQLIDYIAQNYNLIKFHDQDALNGVLYDKTLHVMPQWNMTSIAYVYQMDKLGDRKDGKLINNYDEEKINIKKYLKNPYILHYVSKPKPWQKKCVHPLYDMYYTYAKKTIHYQHIQPQKFLARFPAIFKQYIRERLSVIKQKIVKTDKIRY